MKRHYFRSDAIQQCSAQLAAIFAARTYCQYKGPTQRRTTWLPHLMIGLALSVVCACRDDPGATFTRGEHRALAQDADRKPAVGTLPGCDEVPTSQELERYLKVVPNEREVGGLASGKAEWAAVVNRAGKLCAVAVATADPAQAWVGSQSVAKAKAFTANAFSTDAVAMSTARLYTLSQPGHSLFGIAAANPFDPQCMSTPQEMKGLGRVCGGTIAFGGGVPLYRGKRRIGGLGVSGDTACADHEVAKRLRSALALNPPTGEAADDIQYQGVDAPSVFGHPLCINTWRNGAKIGDEVGSAEPAR
jgi:uncharacterized protein GlcG (DUF336 family)